MNRKGIIYLGALFVVILVLVRILPSKREPSQPQVPNEIAAHPSSSRTKLPNGPHRLLGAAPGTTPDYQPSKSESAEGALKFGLNIGASLPDKYRAIREQTEGIAVVMFVSDYLQDAQNQGKIVSQSELLNALTNALQGTSFNVGRLAEIAIQNLPQGSGIPSSFSEQYELVGKNQEMSAGVQKIDQALDRLGIDTSTDSGLKLECIRFASLSTEYGQFFKSDLDGALHKIHQELVQGGDIDPRDPSRTVLSDEPAKIVNRLRESGNDQHDVGLNSLAQLLQWRLQQRYGVASDLSVTLAQETLNTELSGASPADLRSPKLALQQP